MGRGRKAVRRTTKARPRGILELAADGYGFVSTAEGDFFIPASKTGGAFDGDYVEVAPARSAAKARQGAARPSARVVAVVERAHDTVVGRYEVADPFGVVVPQDPRIPYDIFTMRADSPNIAHGSIVRVRMVDYPSRNTAATGVVEDVLGMEGEPGMDIEAIIARHKLETRFSDAALEQAATAVVDEQGALAAGYADERDRFVFTIDPFDARDFDDAISLVRLHGAEGAGIAHSLKHSSLRCGTRSVGNPAAQDQDSHSGAAWRLGVHIADVSHYVPWGSSVDLDARRRATSVYLVDRVIPMLPEALSNELCSLQPGKPRRVFTVDVFLGEEFQILGADCHTSLIQSKARLSYDQAQCYIDAALRSRTWQDAAHRVEAQPKPQGAFPLDDATHEQLFEAISVLNRFARARSKEREQAGGIDFETTEAKVQLDEEGHARDVVLRTRTEATSCIEEAMILANECVARRLRDSATPGIFRVHDAPSSDALASLVPVLQEFGYDKHVDLVDFVSGSPAALQAVLARAHGRTEAGLVSALLLRAQQRAVYKSECTGHYGLASEAYCHFTSPIRRYPDLVVHRMLRSLLYGRGETYTQECDSLAWLAEHSSKMERIAEAASRESQELKLVEYMQQFVGQTFEGVVSGTTSYGLYVQLDNTVEGLVPIRALGGEYFSLDPLAHKLIGQDTGTVYRLGQRVSVRIAASQAHARKLELSLAQLR